MMAKRDDQIRTLFDLADRKGYDITKAVFRDHYRLIDPTGEIVKRKNGSTAHSLAEAREYLDPYSPDEGVI